MLVFEQMIHHTMLITFYRDKFEEAGNITADLQ